MTSEQATVSGLQQRGELASGPAMLLTSWAVLRQIRQDTLKAIPGRLCDSGPFT